MFNEKFLRLETNEVTCTPYKPFVFVYNQLLLTGDLLTAVVSISIKSLAAS